MINPWYVLIALWLVSCLALWVYLDIPEDDLASYTTKSCPNCANTHLVLINTQNLKLCSDCGARIVWNKETGESDYYV